MSLQLLAPLVRWDGLHVAFNLALVEQHLRDRLRHLPQLADLRLEGRGDAVQVTATVTWKGLRTRIGIELCEIRLRRRRLGFRMRRVRALGGLRVPRRAVEALLARLDPGMVTVIQGQGIVVVDLSAWIPPEVTVSVLTVQVTERSLHVWLGPGEMRDLPAAQRPALAASGASSTAGALPVGTDFPADGEKPPRSP